MEDAAIERERQVILREMSEVNKNQEELVLDHLHATAFQGCSLGRTILGSEENIRSLTRDDLQEYIKTNYTAPRMVLSGAGAIDHSQLVELADKHFGGLPSSSPGGVDVAMEPAVFTGSDYRYVKSYDSMMLVMLMMMCVCVLVCLCVCVCVCFFFFRSSVVSCCCFYLHTHTRECLFTHSLT